MVRILTCFLLVSVAYATRHQVQPSLRQGVAQKPAGNEGESVTVDWPWMHLPAELQAARPNARVEQVISAGETPPQSTPKIPQANLHATSKAEASSAMRALAVPQNHHGIKLPLDGDVTLDPAPPTFQEEVNTAIDAQLRDRLSQKLAAQGASVMACQGANAAMPVPSVPTWVLVTVCIIFVVLFLMLMFYFGAQMAGRAIKSAIETFDRRYLGVDVEIGDLSVSICSGRIDIHGCEIKNPEGYKTPYLLNAGSVVVDINMWALFKSFGHTIEVDVLTLEDIDCIVEYDKAFGGTSNVDKIMEFLSHDEKPSEKKAKKMEEVVNATGKAPPKKAASQEIVLHKVSFTGIGARLATKLAGVRFAIGDMNFDDFSKEQGPGLVEDVVWVIMKTFSKTLMVNITGKSFMDHFTGH